MNRLRLFVLSTIVFFLVFGAVELGTAQSHSQKIDDLIKLYNECRQFNGSVLVAEHGSVILKKGYGFANMEWGIPNQPDTRFRLGSVTKQFTSMVIMQLVQKGMIKLDGHITDYLPNFPKKNGDKVTIHHLLTHTSGIPNYTDFPIFRAELERKAYAPEAFMKTFADSALQFEPGTKWRYSNSGYFILGVIIEKVTGKEYEQVVSENIFIPLKMTGSGYDHAQTVIARRADGYEKRGNGYVHAAYIDMSLPFSAGSLYSTVEDLYTWNQALYSNTLLSDELKTRMFTPFLNEYAYGWGITRSLIGSTTETVPIIQHGGAINGFNTLICRVPGEKHCIVLLNNTGGAPLGPMMRSILAILNDKPFSPPKKSVATELFSTILDKGLARGLSYFKEMRGSFADTFELVEADMNLIGYEFINLKKYEEAIAVFKLNVESFPKSSNCYDSLGEAYMLNGDRELAVRNYEKSLELDPGNTNAVDRLKILRGK